MIYRQDKRNYLPGRVGGVSTAAVVAELHGGQQVLLGESHVHFVLQGLVQDVRVGQGGSLRSLSGHSLPSPTPSGVRWETCLPRHVFVH